LAGREAYRDSGFQAALGEEICECLRVDTNGVSKDERVAIYESSIDG
jgi:hypothetical protein